MASAASMASASALLQLVHDAAAGAQTPNLSESELANRLESVKKQLQRAALPPESNVIALCHVTSQVLAFLVQHRPLAAPAASSMWHKRVLLLETTVVSVFASIASSGDANLELKSDGRRDLCSMFQRLMQRLWETSQAPHHSVNATKIMTKLCVLMAICWLAYDRVGRLTTVEELLNLCSDFCLEHESTQEVAKWPLFLSGMVKMVEKQDDTAALKCLRGAVERCAGSEEEDGAFLYWYAVALIRNELSSDAVSALDKCVQANYEPAACLSLQALINLQAKDCHAASEQLERALEIDVAQSKPLFNYALLMERMSNFEAQQQLLEYILETPGGDVTGQAVDKKRKHPDAIDQKSTGTASTILFDKVSLASLFPSRLSNVHTSMVHFHLAIAAMENGSWLESKQYFEEYFGHENPRKLSIIILLEAARDYIYVLLQCKLPLLALRKCEEYLLKHDAGNSMNEANVVVALLLLHLYKADALLCLERVDDCYEYLQQIVQPKIQGIMDRQEAATTITDSTSKEIASCHTLLLNNLAVIMACRSGADAAISLLHEGLHQYPDCLAIKFNLVLLLWRKDDKPSACSVWVNARGWDLQATTKESKSTGTASPVNIDVAYQNAAVSASVPQAPLVSEHVQGNRDAEDGVSARQLVCLDALILNYWRTAWNSQLMDNSIRSVEYLESLGTTNIPRSN